MYFDSPIGGLAVRFEGSAVSELSFLYESTYEYNGESQTASMRALSTQLQRYFSSAANAFSTPVLLQGTEFQLRVWHALQKIPVGDVQTYGQLAAQLNSSARAVGNACRHNPVPIIVPCHRVVSASGIGGFAGSVDGAEIRTKRWLLRHEGIDVSLLGAA